MIFLASENDELIIVLKAHLLNLNQNQNKKTAKRFVDEIR